MHVITIVTILVQRDAEEMSPIYSYMGLTTGHIVHEMTSEQRIDHYRRSVVYCTSKELVADFLRDQIKLGSLRTGTQTSVGMMLGGNAASQLMVPGLFRSIVDEADSLLIDEGVTPLIISNKPDTEGNRTHYEAALELAGSTEGAARFQNRPHGPSLRADGTRPASPRKALGREQVLEGQASPRRTGDQRPDRHPLLHS